MVPIESFTLRLLDKVDGTKDRSRMTAQLFFGVGVGRCGTMALANLLNSERDAICLHEGKMRHRERPGEKLLPFLTLQNGMAYAHPDKAPALFSKARSNVREIAKESGAKWFGDVAYNYAPFLKEIARTFPEARIFVVFRNGRDFVQSATTGSDVDETPVGWSPNGKPLSHVEQFIAMGRWRPRPAEPWAVEWDQIFDHFEKNAWLWAETNRSLLDALSSIDGRHVMVLRFEDVFSRLLPAYRQLRRFVGFSGSIGPETDALITAPPINRRETPIIGKPETWSADMHRTFDAIAGETMRRLGYR